MSASLPHGLVYVDSSSPGMRRVRRGRGFGYRDADGRWVRDGATLERIRRLAIPPAYEDVWICVRPDGHLQATGRDARGRKQYRYHADFRALRETSKFDRLAAFGRVLQRLRRKVSADLVSGAREPAPVREAVLASIVRLLDTTFVRIGNDAYLRENRSYGLTTLRSQHAGVRGSVLRLAFRGKAGRWHDVSLDDARVARVVRRCQQLPGQELFQFVDEHGTRHSVGSGDVNDYLEETTGERFTAKDFRTWHASVQALQLLCEATGAAAPGKSQRVHVVEQVARQLGNTPAVCRKSYIHPDVLAATDFAALASHAPRRAGLRAAEARLLGLLERSSPRAPHAAQLAPQERRLLAHSRNAGRNGSTMVGTKAA